MSFCTKVVIQRCEWGACVCRCDQEFEHINNNNKKSKIKWHASADKEQINKHARVAREMMWVWDR